MRALLAALLACPAHAGPIASTAAPSTGFPGAYVGTVGLSLRSDPLYGSRLLDSFELHLRSVAAMTTPPAVRDYLEVAVIGAGERSAKAIKASLGREPMDSQRAAALLLAHALARPEQFPEVLEGLEASKPGLGRHAAKLLREADGRGDRRLIAALRSRGEREPKGKPLTYDKFGELEMMFDGASGFGGDAVELSPVAVPASYDGYGPDGRPRRSGLRPSRD